MAYIIMEDIEKIYNESEALEISPNDLIYLFFLFKKTKKDLIFNENISKRVLVKKGYLDRNGFLTKKAEDLFLQKKESGNVEKFREIFPKGILPNGRAARSGHQELEKKFNWFFSNHEYSWTIVLKAAEEYVKYYTKQNYNFMQTSSNFIYKQDLNKVKSSALAEWCEKIKTGEEMNKSYDINV